MKSTITLLVALATLTLATSTILPIGGPDDPRRMGARGDVNNDGIVDLSDAIVLNEWVGVSDTEPLPGWFDCDNQVDANDDGFIDGQDVTFLLYWLFYGGPPPPPPGPFATECSSNPWYTLGCDYSIVCDEP